MQAIGALLGIESSKNRANLEQFLREVDVENTEHMSFQRDFDEELECRATFEQLSHERVVDEAGKNILILKSFETILQERMQSFAVFLTALSKARGSFEVFQYSDGSLRQALDALFVFTEQELQQARLQQVLGRAPGQYPDCSRTFDTQMSFARRLCWAAVAIPFLLDIALLLQRWLPRFRCGRVGVRAAQAAASAQAQDVATGAFAFPPTSRRSKGTHLD